MQCILFIYQNNFRKVDLHHVPVLLQYWCEVPMGREFCRQQKRKDPYPDL